MIIGLKLPARLLDPLGAGDDRCGGRRMGGNRRQHGTRRLRRSGEQDDVGIAE